MTAVVAGGPTEVESNGRARPQQSAHLLGGEGHAAEGSSSVAGGATAGTLLVATHNADKERELRSLLADFPVTVRTLREFPEATAPEETGATLEENAILKARAANEATGLPALADDTGLEVPALGGRPGVRSARYAGEDATYKENCEMLLREMAHLRGDGRAARFVSVIALYRGDGRILLFEGVAEGSIAEAPRGSGGFGYDPVFVSAVTGRTFAQMAPNEKNQVSHRGEALRKLRAYFAETANPVEKAAPTDGLGHLATEV